MTFSGLYNVVFLFSPIGDPSFSLPLHKSGGNDQFIVNISELFFFSVGTQTATGFGNVYPRKWFTRLLVSVQMLISVVFIVVIMGRGVSTLQDRRAMELQLEYNHLNERDLEMENSFHDSIRSDGNFRDTISYQQRAREDSNTSWSRHSKASSKISVKHFLPIGHTQKDEVAAANNRGNILGGGGEYHF